MPERRAGAAARHDRADGSGDAAGEDQTKEAEHGLPALPLRP